MALLEMIEWTDDQGDQIVQRVPAIGTGEIKMGSQLVVRESQAAVFFRDGKALDVFSAGRHTLTTLNLPILTKLIGKAFDDKRSPFKCEVYFVNLRVFSEMKWGTKEPVAFRDSEFGIVRLRAFGNLTMRVIQPLLFVNTLVGVRGGYGTQEVESYLKSVIVSRLNDLMGETIDTILNMPAKYDELSSAVKVRLADDFLKYGVELIDFFISAITPPEEVQAAIDKRSSMGALGNLDNYMKYKTAEAIGDAAKSGGGAGGAMGAGLGAGLGMMMPGMILNQMQQAAGQQAGPQQQPASIACASCGRQVPATSKFCTHCGKPVGAPAVCPSCSAALAPGAKFCAVCGAKIEPAALARCAKCQSELPAGAKFCQACGEKAPGAQ